MTETSSSLYGPQSGYPKVVPFVLYSDPAAAIRWLGEVLALTERLRVPIADGGVGHAELDLDGQVVMIGPAGGRFGEVSSITLVFVDDVDVACRRAIDAGGTVVGPPENHPWGLRQALIADPEGQRWEVTQHMRDVDPADWGARLRDSGLG